MAAAVLATWRNGILEEARMFAGSWILTGNF
jgi:hypothetical protein